MWNGAAGLFVVQRWENLMLFWEAHMHASTYARAHTYTVEVKRQQPPDSVKSTQTWAQKQKTQQNTEYKHKWKMIRRDSIIKSYEWDVYTGRMNKNNFISGD